MPTLQVRPAILDDATAISALFRARISTWQRINAQGQVEDVPYEALTIYERWLHGGPWMSIETAALQLSHLLLGAGLPLVALADNRVIGYSEAYLGSELEPFGEHLHIAHFIASAREAEVHDALMTAWRELAANRRCPRLTAVGVPTDVEAKTFYERHGFQAIAQFQRLSLPARTGQVFFRVTEHPDANPAPMQGWMM
ncbi:MAG TPA: GNAT family N-acetyltransferase, partial [Phototrophicaceae bacterium]|nr:GNAT family N-acetyltransferase [Phototrophicaceae bacterium]